MSQLTDPVVKAIICKVADEYDRLAARAMKRSQDESGTKPRQQQIAEMQAASISGLVALRASM
jgi:hypothetical protein